MSAELLKLDELSRRTLLKRAAQACLGVTMLPGLELLAADPQAKAKHVIYLFMTGAMSHLDTFDLKPGTEVQGETKGIGTSVSGLQVSEHFPNLAKQMQHVAVVRSLYTETGDHEGGRYLMRTSYQENSTIRHPALGAWVHNLGGALNPTLPANVVIGSGGGHPGAGFMPTKFNPVPIGDPNAGLQNTVAPKYLSGERFSDRMALIDGFDKRFRNKYDHKDVKAYTDFYTETVNLLKSTELKAFDLNQEDAKLRDAYGRNPLGQGCLLARRLIEHKVRFVEVAYGNWDHHNAIFEDAQVPVRAKALDQALAALIADLSEKGLLKDTVIAVTTEFGRKPEINANAGRDHHPGVFSGLLCGGPIKGGQAYGESDDKAHSVALDGVTPADYNATIAAALGLPLDKQVFSDTGRPFKVAHDGKPVRKLLR